MYNLLHGRNPDAQFLLVVLGLDEEKVGRFRDAWITKDGEIAIYTRLGGGNRACYCDPTPEEEEQWDKDAERQAQFLLAPGRTQEEIDAFQDEEHKHFVPRKPRSESVAHKPFCHYPNIKALQSRPLYLRDIDETDDDTYATFYFRVPPEFQRKIDQLKLLQGSVYDSTPRERFEEVMKAVEKMGPEELAREFPELAALNRWLEAAVSDKKQGSGTVGTEKDPAESDS